MNYKHLHYFWVVARKGSIARASEQLHLTPQTISAQISALEDQLDNRLFSRTGRQLTLTEAGKLVLDYADEIFSLGGELQEQLRQIPLSRQEVITIGIADVVPKSIAHRLISPAITDDSTLRLVCREGTVESLLADLAIHKLDLVIADGPIPTHIKVKGYNHFLGESGITFLAHPTLARKYKHNFPDCLNNAPMLVPSEAAVIRRRLSRWLEQKQIHPRIIGEFDDSALLKAFGRAGSGIFIAPSSIAGEVEKQYKVSTIASTEDVRDQFYAISVERKISHPAVARITESARTWLHHR